MTKPQTPTDGDALVALALRVEMAAGADRELDRAIKEAIGDPWDYSADWDRWDALSGRKVSEPVARNYTASLDAATKLFPANTMYRSGHSALSPDPSMFFCDAVREDGQAFHTLAKTEELARTSAALRALAARQDAPEADRLTSPTAQGEG